jgi:hypothetical protein
LPTHARSRWSLVAVAVCLSACANPAPGLPPPGSPNGGPARLFFPLAIAVDPTGANVYVANSNFDRSFNSGALMRLSGSLFDTPTTNAAVPLPASLPSGSFALLDSFSSNMVFSAHSSRLYVTTRDHSTLSSAPVASDGSLACPKGDCSSDAIALGVAPLNFQDPFALSLANFTVPGDAGPSNVIVVSHLSQAPTSTDGIGFNTSVAVFREPVVCPATGPMPANCTASGTPFSSAAKLGYQMDLGIPGSNSIAVGPANEILVGGCFLIVPGGTDVPCLADPNQGLFFRANPLRFFFGDVGPAEPVMTQNLGPLLGSVNSGGGLINDLAVSSDGSSLYVANTTPNALLVMNLPQPGLVSPPPARATIPLAATPGRMVVLPRPAVGNVPRGDLIAITATASNALLIVDPLLGVAVAQIEPIGSQPFGLAAARLPSQLGSRVYVTLFNGCSVAAVDVFDDAPELSVLRSTVGGGCPQ